MIPKIIHYCWFGNNPKSTFLQDCIDSWKAHCPDYKIIEWNEGNFDVTKIAYTREAYFAKKYAFVSDYCRLYALNEMGGIYVDVDVRLLKTFNPFLACRSFLGKESPFMISTAVIGAEKGSRWIVDFMDTYNNRHFISRTGKELKQTNVIELTRFFNRSYPKYKDLINFYDVEWFCAKIYYQEGVYCITDDTVAIHEFMGSWKLQPFSLIRQIKNMVYRFLH